MEKIYSVVVDYGKSLDEMIEAGNYEGVDNPYHLDMRFIKRHFTIHQGSGKKSADLVLVTFRDILDWLKSQVEGPVEKEKIEQKSELLWEQIDEYLESQGLLIAKIDHLLALGMAYPELQRQFEIVALGSVWRDSGYFYYPRLLTDGVRMLDLTFHAKGYRWKGEWLILAVRKSA